MDHVAIFLAGAFLCNSIPTASRALEVPPFQTPFAKPRVGKRSRLKAGKPRGDRVAALSDHQPFLQR